jgi:integrase
MDKFVFSLSDDRSAAGRYRQCEVYRSALHRVCLYAGGVYPSLDTVFTPRFLSGFQEHLMVSGLARNTVSFYMSALRSIHSSAVAAGKLLAGPGLFSPFFMGHVTTEKRALSVETVAVIHAADLSGSPLLERCRDLFMASLYLQGMPFVDLLHLRKCDLQGDLLTYTRRKTNRQVCVFVLDDAREYLSRLIDDRVDTPYLLPFITLAGEAGYNQYQNALRWYNDRLKDLAAHLGVADNLTSYVARHTWATMAYHNGVEVSLVSQAMGHRTEAMTHVYLSAFGREHIKMVNQTVSDAVLRPIRDGVVTNVRKGVLRCIKEPAQAAMPMPDCIEPERKMYVNRAERRRVEKEARKEERRRRL